MKKLLKILLIVVAVVAVGIFAAVKLLSDTEPAGESGTKADQLAEEVLKVLNKPAFDTIPYLQWEFFRPGQKYFWDKLNEKAVIEWKDNKVILDLKSLAASAYINGVAQDIEQTAKMKDKAWSLWCNDSFWLIAPFKLFDPGTTRQIIENQDEKGLLVSYIDGGVTPGDKYLWLLDENNRPTGWKMWTSIIPVKGMYSGWSGWENHMGTQLATSHTLAGKEVSLKGVKAGNHWSDFGYTVDPFE